MKSALALVLLAATTASIGCGGGAAFVAAAKSPVVVCNPPNTLVGGVCTAPTPAPTASLSVNPGTISKGESTTLTWQTSNATDASIDGVVVQPNGSESVTPTDSTTYTLTAKGAGGTQTATTMVTVTTPPPPITPAKHYQVVDLVPIPGANNSQANAVYHGHAVGYSLISDGTTRVAFWHDGAVDDLGSGYATSINSTDQIVGYTTQSDGTLHASLWDHGVVTDLGLLAGFDMSVANRINDSGEVVGNAFSSQNTSNQAGFRWTASTGMQAIDGSANALGINAKGDIAEMTQSLQAAVFTATGTTIALGTLGDFSIATSINNSGHAAGYSALVSGGPTHAFFYDGTIHDLGAFGGGDSSDATSMNDDDLIVGNNVGSFGVKFRTLGVVRVVGNGTPFIWSASTGLVDLNTLIDPGFVMSTAGGIDKDGEIVGAGGINGVVHGFLLTPD